MTHTATLAALALAALLVPGRAALAAFDTEVTRPSLKGLHGVSVVVEAFYEKSERAGFDTRTFQTDVELELRMAGIKVLSLEQALDSPGRPTLWVWVSAVHQEPDQRAAFSIILRLVQATRLMRDPEQSALATTWSTSHVGQGDLPFIREHLKDVVGRFINAWLSVGWWGMSFLGRGSRHAEAPVDSGLRCPAGRNRHVASEAGRTAFVRRQGRAAELGLLR